MLATATAPVFFPGLGYGSRIDGNDAVEGFLAVVLGCVLVFNLIANLIAIPALGIYGAAGTTVASEVLLLTIYIVRYRMRMPSLFAATSPTQS